ADEHGGAGMGFIELCLVLEQQGRTVAPMPLFSTLLSALVINEFGSEEQRARLLPPVVAGDVVIAVAATRPVGDVVVAVPVADQIVFGDADGLRIVAADDPGVHRQPIETTDEQPHGRVTIDRGAGERLDGAKGRASLTWLAERVAVARAALMLG